MMERKWFTAKQAKKSTGKGPTYILQRGEYWLMAALLSARGGRHLIRYSTGGPSGWIVQVVDADDGDVVAIAGPTRLEREAKHAVHEQLRAKGYALHSNAS